MVPNGVGFKTNSMFYAELGAFILIRKDFPGYKGPREVCKACYLSCAICKLQMEKLKFYVLESRLIVKDCPCFGLAIIYIDLYSSLSNNHAGCNKGAG